MLRSLFVSFSFLLLLGVSFAVPFVAVLGYVWVDIFRPQNVAYSILTELPVSAIIGAVAFASYALLDRRHPPRLSAGIVVLLAWAGWITLTTLWAAFPALAWVKWDWAFKTILFAAFIPFAIRSRIQIEAFILVFLLSSAIQIVPFGAKTILSGGGYGRNLGVIGGNSLLAESSTLSAVSCMVIPLTLFLWRSGRILPSSRIIQFGYLAFALMALSTVIGTHARTGLVALAVLGAAFWWRTKHKILTLAAVAVFAVVVSETAGDLWKDRMATIGTYSTESSAMTRIAVWRWTLEYVAEHPFGGGFDAYLLSRYKIESTEEGRISIEITGRAFHSIYFEVLGEHGIVGLILFLLMFLTFFINLNYAKKLSKDRPDLIWCQNLSFCLNLSMLTLMVSGIFVGFAFLPFHYYLVGLSIALREYVRRATTSKTAVRSGHRRLPIAATPEPVMRRS